MKNMKMLRLHRMMMTRKILEIVEPHEKRIAREH